MKNREYTTKGIELVRKLAQEGYRIFTGEDAQKFVSDVGLSKNYLNQALFHLVHSGWLVRLHKGLYGLSSSMPGISSLHEFEIAMSLVKPAAISHWSALHYHGLTEQIPRCVFVLTTNSVNAPRTLAKKSNADYFVGGMGYRFIKVKPERYFGTENIWVGDARVVTTDPERTLLDGLMKPQYCGDFSEVLHAFQVYSPKLDIEKIISYALKLDTVTAKRLGWILEYVGVDFSKLELLSVLPICGYRVLDVSGPKKGRCNSRWFIQENLRGNINS